MEVLSIVLQIPYMFAELSTIPPIGHIERTFVVSESSLEFSRGQTYVGFFLSFRGHTCMVHHILGLAGPIDWVPWLVSAVTTITSKIAHNILPLLAVICCTNLSMFGFSVFLLQILCRGCCFGKQLFTILRNLLPILVSTFQLNGGLNHIMSLFLFLFTLST